MEVIKGEFNGNKYSFNGNKILLMGLRNVFQESLKKNISKGGKLHLFYGGKQKLLTEISSHNCLSKTLFFLSRTFK